MFSRQGARKFCTLLPNPESLFREWHYIGRKPIPIESVTHQPAGASVTDLSASNDSNNKVSQSPPKPFLLPCNPPNDLPHPNHLYTPAWTVLLQWLRTPFAMIAFGLQLVQKVLHLLAMYTFLKSWWIQQKRLHLEAIMNSEVTLMLISISCSKDAFIYKVLVKQIVHFDNIVDSYRRNIIHNCNIQCHQYKNGFAFEFGSTQDFLHKLSQAALLSQMNSAAVRSIVLEVCLTQKEHRWPFGELKL